MSNIKEFNLEFIEERSNSFYICAGGFEDRSRAIVENLKNNGGIFFKYSLILKYSIQEEDNKPNLEFIQDNLPKITLNLLENTIVNIDDIYQTINGIIEAFKKIPQEDIKTVFIDISGMANSLILLIINQAKKAFFGKEIIILYAEANIYYPAQDEIDEILKLMESDEDQDILKLGDKLGTSGAREVIILPDFKGYFAENKPICLIFFAGYEPSRAAGLLDDYRPNMVIVCYGVPPYKKFKWRTKFSKQLHKKLLKEFEHVEKDISTFYISDIVNELDKIYKSIVIED